MRHNQEGQMLEIRQLTDIDTPLLQTLLEECHEYLAFQEGTPVKPDAAVDFLKWVPQEVQFKQKNALGIYQNQQLIGIFELFMHYKAIGTLQIALMMLSPANRGLGIGEKAYQSLEQWSIAMEMSKIRLGVLEENPDALAFWERMHFFKTGEKRPYKHQYYYVLEKQVS
jgi:ribosomal protein S18 acetylase RimI-like enzyme